jgi:hypothetical protein
LGWPLVIQGYFAPSIGRLLGLGDWLSFGLFLGLLALPWVVRSFLPSQRPVLHRLAEFGVGLALVAVWVVALMAALPAHGRRVETALLRAQTFMGVDADERAGRKSWQRQGRGSGR